MENNFKTFHKIQTPEMKPKTWKKFGYSLQDNKIFKNTKPKINTDDT